MNARDIHHRETTELSEKPRLGKILTSQVPDWKKASANDCRVREKPEISVRRASGDRFTAKDPLRFNGGDTNLMAYVKNDVVNYFDETGNGPVAAVGTGGFCVGLAIGDAINSYMDPIGGEDLMKWIRQYDEWIDYLESSCPIEGRSNEHQQLLNRFKRERLKLTADLVSRQGPVSVTEAFTALGCAAATAIAAELPTP